MILIDKLAYSSRLRRKSPVLKMLFSIGPLLICVWAQSPPISIGILAVMSCLAVFCGGVAPRRYIKLLSIPLSFLALSTVAVVIHYADTPSQLLSLKFGGGYLAVDDASLLYGVNLFFTALSAVSCLYFLSLTTPMVDIMGALRRMRCPAILIELMFLMYRFTFVLLDTAHAISTSQKCRLGNRDFRTSLRAAGSLLAVLLQRAMFQSSMLYSAMESRCYDGHIRVLSRTSRSTAKEKAAVYAFWALLLALAVLYKINGGF